MRQASWNEMFAAHREQPLVLAPEMPEEPQGWRRLFWWEDLLTFGLLGIVFLSVVVSINQAHWVDDMPSLYAIAFLGLAMGALLARVRWPEGFLHLLALPVGAGAALAQILLVVPGPTPWDRFETLAERMHDWLRAAFGGGISNDGLPFIVLVVALSWLAAYLSSWAVFRWRNAWLGLIPGGWALLTNISYLPGQFSSAFVVFLFGGALLLTRLHLMQRANGWRQDGTPYPPYLSLSVLHATFWLALALVVLAWLLPQANQADALESVWRRATAPVTERVEGLSRLFISVDYKKGGRVHRFDDTLPFLGSIELPETLVLDVTTEPLDQPLYLRERVYGIYTSSGWQQHPQQTSPLERYEVTEVDGQLERRRAITIEVVATGRTGETVFSPGQPRRVDRPVTVHWGGAPEDVTAVEAEGDLADGAMYTAVGSLSAASKEALRAASTDYPDWVRLNYLELPDDFPTRVRDLARDLTRSETNPYDKAEAIEAHLRTIPYDLEVPDTPVGRDAIEYFLFEAQRGYFDYHASAMVVMLRSVGIPSRLAVGYVLQREEREAEGDRYLVTEESTFAWPEVYFPGFGWVEFNPTPNLPTIERPGEEEDLADSPGSGDAITDDLGLGDTLEPPQEGGGPPSEGLSVGASSDRNRWVLIGIMAGLAAVLGSGAGALRYAWVRGLTGLDPAARLWGQTVRLASWARLPPAATQTPREYARTLREKVPDVDEIDLLAEAYARHRYGRGRLQEAEQSRLEEAWRAVRTGLLRRLLRLR